MSGGNTRGKHLLCVGKDARELGKISLALYNQKQYQNRRDKAKGKREQRRGTLA